MPPIEPPTTANSRPIPRWSTRRFCARTMSRMVTGGKSVPHGSPVHRPGRARPGGADAGAEHVGADHEEAVGVDRPARADHRLPPAGLAGQWVAFGEVLVPGQRMADQDGVAAAGVQRAVGAVGDVDPRQALAAIQRERPGSARAGGSGPMALGGGRVGRSTPLCMASRPQRGNRAGRRHRHPVCPRARPGLCRSPCRAPATGRAAAGPPRPARRAGRGGRRAARPADAPRGGGGAGGPAGGQGAGGAAAGAGGRDHPPAARPPLRPLPAGPPGAAVAGADHRHDDDPGAVRAGGVRAGPGERLHLRRARAFRRADPVAGAPHPGAGDRRGERRAPPPPPCCRCPRRRSPPPPPGGPRCCTATTRASISWPGCRSGRPRPEGARELAALVVSVAPPDPSGADRSFLGLEVGMEQSRARLASVLADAGFDGRRTVLRRDPGAGAARVLVDVAGFVAETIPGWPASPRFPARRSCWAPTPSPWRNRHDARP